MMCFCVAALSTCGPTLRSSCIWNKVYQRLIVLPTNPRRHRRIAYHHRTLQFTCTATPPTRADTAAPHITIVPCDSRAPQHRQLHPADTAATRITIAPSDSRAPRHRRLQDPRIQSAADRFLDGQPAGLKPQRKACGRLFSPTPFHRPTTLASRPISSGGSLSRLRELD